MSISKPVLVRSKLLVPSPAGLLHRPRVCRSIGQGLACRLTIVSAPAGYGKTSALVDFVQHTPIPVCWYTADERDRDLGVFVEYIIGAVRERFPGFGERTLIALEAAPGELFQNPAPVVGELVNELVEIGSPLVLVVDNYEVLDGAAGIRAFLHRLLDLIPPNVHLMLGSRVLPDVPITQLVAKRQLVGLTVKDLRFEPEEIRELLQLLRIEVSEAQAEAIAENSEGWITGVLLLADLLRETARTALTGAERATAEAYEYLAREVLSRQPPDIQDFLQVSAVLREMSVRLCRDVLDLGASQALLAEVERRNLFITRFGEGAGATYQYHNLFRDFLHERLHQYDPDRYTELHRRAAGHFEQEGDVEEAVYHYLTAGMYPQATAVMERVAMEWFVRGRVEALVRWGEELPEEVRDQAPRLSLYQSKVLTDRYDYEGARRALTHAESGFAAQGDVSNLAMVHIQRATLGLFEGRYGDTLAEAQAALEKLAHPETAKRAEALRLIGRASIGLGHVPEGIARLREALALYRQVGSPYNVANLLQDLTLAFTMQGLFDEAAACLNEALTIGRRLDAPTLLAGVLNNLGWLHHMRGEYQEALALYEEGLAAARRGGVLWLQANISVGMADLYRDLGAYGRAEPLYNAGWQIARTSEPGLAVYILTAQADMYRWRGEYGRSAQTLEQARHLAEEKGLEFELQGLLPMSEGILLAERGEGSTGHRALSEAVRFLEQRKATRELARARFLLAKAHFLAGDRARAVAELRLAMGLAKEIGTDQFAVAEGQHSPGLLELGIAEGVTACLTTAEKVRKLRAFAGREGEMAREETAFLEIYAFGGGRVVRDGHLVSSSEWQASMAKELFFYILLHGPVSRDAVGLVFWPDASPKGMRDSFHTTLYRIRRALGTEAVVMEEGEYRLGDVAYWFDVEEFETLVGRARLLPPGDWQTEHLWQQAVALYKGDFLPEVERIWCVPKREALRQMYIEALIGLGACYEARGEVEEAVAWYRRALEVDELREDVHRQIMRCYASAGRRPEAVAQYRQCREILRRELGVDPSAETKELYRRIVGKGTGRE